MIAGVAFLLPQRTPYPLGALTHLKSDLETMGGPALSGHVQCLDMTTGSCVNALYRLQLVQSTGTISDFYLFADRPTSFTTGMQQQFLQQVISSPPRLFIMSTQHWPDPEQGYQRLSNFPRFEDFLRTHYTVRREFDGYDAPAGYRIYVLNGAG